MPPQILTPWTGASSHGEKIIDILALKFDVRQRRRFENICFFVTNLSEKILSTLWELFHLEKVNLVNIIDFFQVEINNKLPFCS